MKKVTTPLILFSVFIFLSVSLFADDRFDRRAVIPAQPDDIGGFGNIVAGVDFDGDGKVEIYTVNNDWHDVIGGDLTPRIYKYEKNDRGRWEIVWWTRLDFDFQNTWPILEAADLDNDGKGEIVWGPVNNFGGTLNPNPPRIVVFETVGDGSDVMGIDNGDGTYSPNASFTITPNDNDNVRPFRAIITDIDQDGTDEIVVSARVGDGIQIYSTDDVPDAGDGSETWTIEFSGVAGTYYDLAIIGQTIYAIRDNGNVTSVTYVAAGDSFIVGDEQLGVVGLGSWKSAATVDIDNDGTEEIIVASWNSATSNVYLLQQDGDSLKSTIIQDVPDESFRLYGGAAGDLDNDGNLDFVFGTRSSTPNALIHRLEYDGTGAIDDPNSYELSNIDQGISPAVQYDVIFLANVDGGPADEVIYSGTPRGQSASDPPQPIVILDKIPGNQPIVREVKDVPGDNGKQVWVVWEGSQDDVGGKRFTAELSGDNQPTPVATVAGGRATFTLNRDENTLSYLVEVTNITGVTQAHIHQGAPDVNGAVGVFLFGFVDGGTGTVNGILASGTITEGDLIGPWAGDVAAFAADLLAGNTYVNVHTVANPGGEIRGQVLTDFISTDAPESLNKSSGFTIEHYDIWRIDGGPNSYPVQVGRADALHSHLYAAVVPTLMDGEEPGSTFIVSAHSENSNVFWKSFPKSGFSLDNLAPSPPATIAATETAEGVQLNWDEPTDDDFNFFSVVRGTEAGFDPNTADAIGTTSETQFLDTNVEVGQTLFYRIAATDFNGNRGAFSEEVSLNVTSVSESGSSVPTDFALHQNYPNPFNPETTIQYDIPVDTDVTLKIYNLIGQEITTLVNEPKSAGSYTVRWNGRDKFGIQVSSGVYLYVIRAGDFAKSNKMTFVK